MSPDIDEKSVRTDDFYKLPILIAGEKLNSLKNKINEPTIIIAADQVVVCDNELREKPDSKEKAFGYLKKYSDGYPAETVSALIVFNNQNDKTAEGVDVAKIYFKPIPDSVIKDYIDTGEAYLNSGGFDHKHLLLKPYVKEIQGTSDSLSGMPIKLLKELIKSVQ